MSVSADKRQFQVLMIDDSPVDRRVYRRFLLDGNPAPIAFTEAGNAHLGISECQRLLPDCIILDFRLPDMSGLDVISELRKITSAPIIFITGHPLPLTHSQSYREANVKYLSKNLMSSALLQEAVGAALGNARSKVGN